MLSLKQRQSAELRLSSHFEVYQLDYVVDLNPDMNDRELIQQFLFYDKVQDIPFPAQLRSVKLSKQRKTSCSLAVGFSYSYNKGDTSYPQKNI